MKSNVEKLPIQIPNNINLKLYSGSNYKLLRINNNETYKQYKLPITTKIEIKNNKLNIKESGTIRTLINNWIIGLSKNIYSTYIIKGIGGKAVQNKNKLILNLGKSVPNQIEIPENIEIKIKGTNTIIAKSYSKLDLSKFINKIKLLNK